MFVRVKSRNNTKKKAVQIVKSYRNGDKVRQKVMYTVGYAFDEDTLNRLKDVAEHLKAKLKNDIAPSLFSPEESAKAAIKARNKAVKKKLPVDLNKIREKSRIVAGFHDVYGMVYKLLNFERVVKKRYKSSAETLFHITMARLANPVSKRSSVSLLAKDFGLDISLDKVYRMMDVIDDKVISKIQTEVFNAANTLIKGKVKVALYDCTTLYFESFKPDELKENGYSKDGKFNQPQVLLALTVTEDGLPLGYDVFPGSTFEGNTLKPVLTSIKSKYNLEELVVVADSGLMSKENIRVIESLGYSYILGARLRNMPKGIQESILNGLSLVTNHPEEGEKLFEISHDDKRLVVRRNEKRARKDREDREEAIRKLKKKLSKSRHPKSLLSNYGYKKYIKYADKTMRVYLDDSKLEYEEKWDGVSGVITNVKGISKEKITEYYKGLWQIESCFRVQKHDLKVRPIFHWTPRRVKSHIVICYMAFSCQQYLRYRLKLQKKVLSANQIKLALSHVQLSILEDVSTKKNYGLPSSINETAKMIYKVLRIKHNITPYEIYNKK